MMNIISIIVLYNCKIKDSKTIISLQRNYKEKPEIFSNFHIIIYDNGAFSQNADLKMPFDFSYINKPDNEGLAAAYNYALGIGEKKSSEWLLLLDQDSDLPNRFIFNLLEDIKYCKANPNVVGLVPRMITNGYVFSPSKVLPGGIHRPIDSRHFGISKSEIFAVGSCSLVNISFLKSINGFNQLFWLDSLDRWLFMMIYSEGKNVFVSNSVVEHDLSIMDYGKSVSAKRYENIMKYETIFMILYKTRKDNIIYYTRLIKRLIFFSIKPSHWKYFLLTFQHLIKLLFKSNNILNSNKSIKNECCYGDKV